MHQELYHQKVCCSAYLLLIVSLFLFGSTVRASPVQLSDPTYTIILNSSDTHHQPLWYYPTSPTSVPVTIEGSTIGNVSLQANPSPSITISGNAPEFKGYAQSAAMSGNVWYQWMVIGPDPDLLLPITISGSIVTSLGCGVSASTFVSAVGEMSEVLAGTQNENNCYETDTKVAESVGFGKTFSVHADLPQYLQLYARVNANSLKT